MTTEKKKTGIVSQIFVAVIIALLVGGTSPWWWKEFFGNGEQGSGYTQEPQSSQGDTSKDPSPINSPEPDFSSGSTRVYSSVFSEWPESQNEHGSIRVKHGTYVLQPSSNTWIGPGRWMDITTLEKDFVIDLRFRIKERNPSAVLSLGLASAGQDADYVKAYLDVWSSENVTYSLEKGRIKDNFYVIRENSIAEREQVPVEIRGHDWANGATVTLKRQGGIMQFFVNGSFVRAFPISRFRVSRLSLGAAFKSTLEVTSIEARIP